MKSAFTKFLDKKLSQHKINIKALAILSGLNENRLMIITEENSPPTKTELNKIAYALGMSMADLNKQIKLAFSSENDKQEFLQDAKSQITQKDPTEKNIDTANRKKLKTDSALNSQTPSGNNIGFGDFLNSQIKAYGLNKAAVSSLLGLPEEKLQLILNGSIANQTELKKICNLFNLNFFLVMRKYFANQQNFTENKELLTTQTNTQLKQIEELTQKIAKDSLLKSADELSIIANQLKLISDFLNNEND